MPGEARGEDVGMKAHSTLDVLMRCFVYRSRDGLWLHFQVLTSALHCASATETLLNKIF
jgi:hypothetical protein